MTNNLMRVAVRREGAHSLRFGIPEALFSTTAAPERDSIHLAPDGRILVNHLGEASDEPLRLIENWARRLPR